MSTYEALLERAKRGQISGQEIAMVARELQKPEPGADAYTLLHILGVSGAVQYQGLVERFLSSREDPMLARLALQILCNYWHGTDRYIEDVRRFIRGVPWDVDEDVRMVAISTAGEYLRSHSHPEMLQELIHIFEDENERPIIRESAYCALGRAMGRQWSDLPPASRHFDLVTGIDPAVLHQARERLSLESG